MTAPYEITTNVIAEYQHPSGYVNVHGANMVQTLGHQGDCISFRDGNREYELLYNYNDSETVKLVLFEKINCVRGEGLKEIVIYKPQE